MTAIALRFVPQSARAPMLAIAPIAGSVFSAFFVIGMALPVLPLHVHQRLGMSPFVVGLVAGSQFAAALLSRLWAGRITDTHGAKRAVLMGLIAAIAGAVFYLISLLLVETPGIAFGVLLIGRALVGGAESLIITGSMLWALRRLSPDRSAQAIAWVGMSMFAAMALGAPVGSFVFAQFEFFGIALATTVVLLVTLALIAPMRALPPVASEKAPLSTVLRAVLLPGVGFALSGITFGSVTTFLTLYFALRGWAHGAVAFSMFALALIAMRVFGGHLPDRIGGARVALYCLGIQAVGLMLIAVAGAGWIAIVGAGIARAGFSLVFPSLGLEAVGRVSPGSRGIAMGAYNAFVDLTLGIGSPLLGLLAGNAGMQAVFWASAAAAVVAIPVTLYIKRQPASAYRT